MTFQWRRLITSGAILLLPTPLLRGVLRALGHRISGSARIGFSLIWSDRLFLGPSARIGHGNIIAVRRILMRDSAEIGRLNILHGPFSVSMRPLAAIGNGNKVLRAPIDVVTVGPAWLRLGELSKVGSNHHLDCTCSIWVGDFCVFAGIGSQVWTHGYVHDVRGPDRYRIEGPVTIGSNVYIGARCVISLGLHIASGAIVGAGSTVSQSLDEAALYVGQSLRKLPRPAEPGQRSDLARQSGPSLTEIVYRRMPRSAPGSVSDAARPHP